MCEIVRKQVIIMHDWDGTDVDTMPSHADLAAKVIRKHFGLNISEARSQYLATTGIPFDGQLEKIFPSSSEAERKACAREYHERKMQEVYARPKTFPGLREVLELSRSLGYVSVISSSTEEGLIKAWAKREGLEQYFEVILGREHGTKTDHIKIVQGVHSGHKVFFLSDSVGDMNLPAVTIGVCVPQEKHAEFNRAGAYWVFSSPPSMEVIEKIQSNL